MKCRGSGGQMRRLQSAGLRIFQNARPGYRSGNVLVPLRLRGEIVHPVRPKYLLHQQVS